MNAQATAQTERKAFLSLALSERRHSWLYRKWAREDEARGDLNAYRKHAAEARRLWRSAKFHIEKARSRTWH